MPSSTSKTAPSYRRPNLLFILTDQQRVDSLSCMGGRFVETPNLDRLAREGASFENAVCASPICVPARTSILTGQAIHQHGCWNNPLALDPEFACDASYDQHLEEQGYATEYWGRWHAPGALLEGYDSAPLWPKGGGYAADLRARLGDPPKPAEGQIVNPCSGWPYDPDPMDQAYRQATGDSACPPKRAGKLYGVETLPPEYSYSARVADQTIDALRRNAQGPFAISAAFVQPHPPLILPPVWADRVKVADMEPPTTLHDSRSNTFYHDFDEVFDDCEREYIQLIMARYYAAVLEVDHHIGRILDTLDTLGLADDTLVVLTSDHGEMLGDHGMTQKFVFYTASVRVPLLMRLPGRIASGLRPRGPASHLDLYPTILGLLDSPSEQRGGLDLGPLLKGEQSDVDRFVVSQFEDRHIMIRNAQWKYAWSRSDEEVDLLFNLEDDPEETENLLGDNPRRSRYLAAAALMKSELVAWMGVHEHPWLAPFSQANIH